MIKKAIHNAYRHRVENDKDFDILYYRNYIHLHLEYFVKRRVWAYELILIVSAILMPISQQKDSPLPLITWSLLILIAFALALFIIHFMNKQNLYEKILSKYFDNSDKLCDWLLKQFTLFHNNVISFKDWRKIKSLNSKLYVDLMGDGSFGFCYHYSRELGLLLNDVNLVWCSLYEPFDQSYFAHAFILKNGYLYDSNLRLSYNFEEYSKRTNLKIYKIWSYEEYSIPNFRSTVREDFRKWCKENQVEHYNYF